MDTDWIPFEEGEYIVERAFFFSPEGSAVLLDDAAVIISLDRMNRRRMSGMGKIRNILLVDLLDEHDEIDLALDLGGKFKYLMRKPAIEAGKVFSPDVRSALRFIPRTPWERVSEADFEALRSRCRFLSHG
jgi:hypothetical protein